MPDGQSGNLIIKALADWAEYIALFVLALWGGTASYINRIRKDNVKFSAVELIGEWAISGFAGVITALICNELGYSFYITAALAGIAGHMGGRAVHMLEQFFMRKVGASEK